MPPAKKSDRKAEFLSPSGLPRPAFTSTGSPELRPPGTYPFTRGVHPGGYRSRFWTMRQYAGFGTARESNERYRYLLAQGTMGLSVAFDLPTQIGYDSDDPHAMGEVGRVGVAIDSLEDMETLFRLRSPRSGLHVDDHQFDGVDPARAVHRGGAAARHP
jgi:methylmalonyl-CoA mutase N-terminal domain/subunit